MSTDHPNSESQLYRAVQSLYNDSLRPRLPRKTANYNGVSVRRPRLLDRDYDKPDYEAPLIEGLREHVQETDDVVIVGAGWGVTAAVAAQQGANVTAYEAGDEQLEHARETVRLNDVDDNVTVEHQIVATGVDIYGGTSAPVFDPSELPPCDVLELDCEGAEMEILRELEYRPRVLLVEVHPNFGILETNVRDQIDTMGYEVVDRGVENEELGVIVLTAIQSEEM